MRTRTAFLLLFLSCWFVHPLVAAEPLNVSIIKLIANPKDYDGKVVQVIGFVSLEFEGHAIYLHRDDYQHCINKNGLWIDVSNEIIERQAEFDQKYVLVEGIFNAKKTGHMGLWSGSIEKITRFQTWIDRDAMRKNAEDGQQSGASSGSQPIRSETNRTSSAVGSRR